jgi:hypothetical protein
VIKVPNFIEFSAVNIFNRVKDIPRFMQYLPDLGESRVPNREYLLNIVNTVDPSYFRENIKWAYKQRKDFKVQKEQKKCEMSTFMYELIKSSNQITTGSKSRALNMLGVGVKKRDRKGIPRKVYDTLKQFQQEPPRTLMFAQRSIQETTAY